MSQAVEFGKKALEFISELLAGMYNGFCIAILYALVLVTIAGMLVSVVLCIVSVALPNSTYSTIGSGICAIVCTYINLKLPKGGRK